MWEGTVSGGRALSGALQDRQAGGTREGMHGRGAVLAAGVIAGTCLWCSCGPASSGGGGTELAPSLVVVPPTGVASFETAGSLGQSSETYRLSNTGAVALTWSAGATQPWLFLDRTGGILAPGAETTLTVTHPRQHESAFVLATLADLAPDLKVPGSRSVTARLASVAPQPNARLDT